MPNRPILLLTPFSDPGCDNDASVGPTSRRSDAHDLVADGTVYVITRYRDRNANLRTQFQKIIARAGHQTWPRLFHDLLASCETELMAKYSVKDVSSWLGNILAASSAGSATLASMIARQSPTCSATTDMPPGISASGTSGPEPEGHPSPFGQQLYADSIERLLDAAWAEKPRPVTAHAMPKKLDPFCYDEGQLFPPQTAVNTKGFAILTDYDADADGGKIRRGWNEIPQLVGQKPGDSFELKFKGPAFAIMVIAGPRAGIVEHSVDGSSWEKQDLFTRHSPHLHLQRISMLRDGLDPQKEHILKARIANERNELSVGNDCRIVHFGIDGDPRKLKNIGVDGIYFEGSDGHGPER